MNNTIIFFCFCMVLFLFYDCSSGTDSSKPMKFTQKIIQNGEVLKYSVMENGKKTGDFTIVNTIDESDEKDKTITAYMAFVEDGSKVKIPGHYTNYPASLKVSMKNGSLISFYEDKFSNSILSKEKGPVITDLQIDEKSGLVIYNSKTWNGYNLKASSSKLKIKPGYPVWNWNEIMFLGLRYLDSKNPGYICMVVPIWIKTPFLGRFIFKGREVVETKAGKFNTIKLGWAMGNIFLSRLMEIFYKEYFFWVDEETGILVKETGSGNDSAELEEMSIWK